MSTWKNREFSWTIKDVGAQLLDSITGGTYSKLDVFREYVQNAVDSYANFQRVTGMVPRNDVQVWVDERNKSLSIMDYGLGMDWDDIDTAKKIAVSPKLERSMEYVGFRGIGIWSGLSACEKIVITTTKYGVPVEFRMTIECKEIVERISPIPIDELLRDRVHIEERDGEEDEHFTSVTLLGVNQEAFGELLDERRLIDYTKEKLPVPFDPSWKDEKGISYTDIVNSILEDVRWNTNYNVTINDVPVYRQFPSPKAILPPEKKIVLDLKEKVVAIAWVSETRRAEGSRRGVIDTSDGSVSNFSIRIKNFVVGERGQYSEEGVSDPNNLNWYVGEIYIVDPDVKPDTKRALIQSNERHDEVVKAIRRFYTSTALRARALSDQLRVLQKCSSVTVIIQELEGNFSQQYLDDFERGKNQAKIQDALKRLLGLRKDIEEVLEDINRDDKDNPAERVLIVREYYRKKEVREAVNTALGQINAFIKRWESAIQENASSVVDTSTKSTGKRKGRSQARTKVLSGTPVSPENVFTTSMPGDSVSVMNGLDNNSTPSQPYPFDIDAAVSAFKAAVAAVIGENTESYHRIVERIPEELRRRGFNV